MTREEELIEMLKILKEQARKSCNDTAILDVKIDSFIFVIDEAIKALEQEPKIGHWIYIGNSDVNGLKICECDVCGKRTYGSHAFCPNCGVKMESEE